MCPERFSEIYRGNHWHKILFSCSEAELLPFPVLQALWGVLDKGRSVLVCCTVVQVLDWPRTGAGAEPCSSLPSLVLALHSGALRLGKDLAPAVVLGARAGGPGSACCCELGRAGSSAADSSSASSGCVWQGSWCADACALQPRCFSEVSREATA